MNKAFFGPRITAVSFVTLMGAFGLNLTGGLFFTPLNQTYHWDLTTLSLAVSLNMLTWGVLQPVAGTLIDRFGPKPILIFGTSLMGISFMLCATISQIWQFFLYYGFLASVGFAACASMPNAVLISRWYFRKRVKMLAISTMGINIGQLLLLPATGFLLANFGFRTAFIVLGASMLLVVTPLIVLYVENSPSVVGQGCDGDRASSQVSSPPPSIPLSEALRTKDFWFTALGFVTCGYALYLITIHLPKYVFDLGGGTALGGQMLGIAAGASAISMWFTGQLTAKFPKKYLLVSLYVIRALAFIIIASSNSIASLYLFAVIYGISSFPTIPLVTEIIGSKFGGNAMGSILGSVWLMHQIAASTGVFLGGYLRSTTTSYHLAFWTCAVLLFAGGVVTLFVDDSKHISRPQVKAEAV